MIWTETILTREDLFDALIKSAEPHGITKTQKVILESISEVASLERTSAGFVFTLQDICDRLDGLPPLAVGFELGQFVGSANGYGDMFGRLPDGSWGVQVCPSNRSLRNCFVYVMDNGFHRKLGISNNPEKRRSALYTASSLPIDVVYRIRLKRSECQDIEKRVHRAHARDRANGEWFSSPAHELIQSVRHAIEWADWFDDEYLAGIESALERVS